MKDKLCIMIKIEPEQIEDNKVNIPRKGEQTVLDNRDIIAADLVAGLRYNSDEIRMPHVVLLLHVDERDHKAGDIIKMSRFSPLTADIVIADNFGQTYVLENMNKLNLVGEMFQYRTGIREMNRLLGVTNDDVVSGLDLTIPHVSEALRYAYTPKGNRDMAAWEQPEWFAANLIATQATHIGEIIAMPSFVDNMYQYRRQLEQNGYSDIEAALISRKGTAAFYDDVLGGGSIYETVYNLTKHEHNDIVEDVINDLSDRYNHHDFIILETDELADKDYENCER